MKYSRLEDSMLTNQINVSMPPARPLSAHLDDTLLAEYVLECSVSILCVGLCHSFWNILAISCMLATV